jgi:hypothetical protein
VTAPTRDPKRWLALLGILIGFAVVWYVGDLFWPGWGEWLAAALVLIGLGARMRKMRRRSLSPGPPPKR